MDNTLAQTLCACQALEHNKIMHREYSMHDSADDLLSLYDGSIGPVQQLTTNLQTVVRHDADVAQFGTSARDTLTVLSPHDTI